MRFQQWEQVLGLKLPLKSQTRRVSFPFELAKQLWRWWDYWPEPPWSWKEWLRDFPIQEEQIAEANRILAEHVITLAVQPSRGKAVGRIRVLRIRRERLGDISGEDSMAEGIILVPYEAYMCPVCHKAYEWPQEAYACLWNCCGGRWEQDQNDDVWVLGFESGSGL